MSNRRPRSSQIVEEMGKKAANSKGLDVRAENVNVPAGPADFCNA